ncbi:MAG: 4-phosphopantoate--beta-alanine ligase [Candidatus Methanomethylicia archaeon]
MSIPVNHPRRQSLLIREKIVEGFRNGIVVAQGLIAHGRGEAFDYIIGEVTPPPTYEAITAAAAALITARKPVISVNGNTAVLVGREIVKLSSIVGANIEVNLFHRVPSREIKIRDYLIECGANNVLGVGDDASATIPELMSERRRVSPYGILVADVVLVPLEDGDRTEALTKMGKTVIAIDLNPFSRTSRKATITIVDNVVRAIPILIDTVLKLKCMTREDLENIIKKYDNRKVLSRVIEYLHSRLREESRLNLLFEKGPNK